MTIQLCIHATSDQARAFFERLADESDDDENVGGTLRHGLKHDTKAVLERELGMTILSDEDYQGPVEIPPQHVIREYVDKNLHSPPTPPWFGPGGYGIFAAGLKIT